MPRLLSTQDAVADLDGIWDHIAHHSRKAADLELEELQNRFILLSRFPEIGELQHHPEDGTYRRFAYRNYVIYYRRIEDGIVLVRVLHGALDPE